MHIPSLFSSLVCISSLFLIAGAFPTPEDIAVRASNEATNDYTYVALSKKTKAGDRKLLKCPHPSKKMCNAGAWTRKLNQPIKVECRHGNFYKDADTGGYVHHKYVQRITPSRVDKYDWKEFSGKTTKAKVKKLLKANKNWKAPQCKLQVGMKARAASKGPTEKRFATVKPGTCFGVMTVLDTWKQSSAEDGIAKGTICAAFSKKNCSSGTFLGHFQDMRSSKDEGALSENKRKKIRGVKCW